MWKNNLRGVDRVFKINNNFVQNTELKETPLSYLSYPQLKSQNNREIFLNMGVKKVLHISTLLITLINSYI